MIQHISNERLKTVHHILFILKLGLPFGMKSTCRKIKEFVCDA